MRLVLISQCPDLVPHHVRHPPTTFPVAQFGRENRAKPMIALASPGAAELHRQAIGVHDGMNLCRQPPSGSAHVLLTIARDAASVLMHAYD